MLVEEKAFMLKDGRRAVLRSPREGDAARLLQYLTAASGETDFILRTPEECEKLTLEGEKQWIEHMNSSETDITLLCEIDDKIAGNCGIFRDPWQKTRHRARVAIALLREFWRQGIGTKMFEEMIRIAESWDGVSQIELEFVEGNARAQGLYEKMGFHITGVRPDAIRLRDGTLLNEYMMVKKLER